MSPNPVYLRKDTALETAELSPQARSGLPAAFTYGGTSWGTREPPPMKAWTPIETN